MLLIGCMSVEQLDDLFAVAAFWGMDGSLLEFWDDALWLVAFIFFE